MIKEEPTPDTPAGKEKLDEFVLIENIVNEKLAKLSIKPVQTILWMKTLKKD